MKGRKGSKAQGAKKKILIVDDEKSLLSILKAVLSSQMVNVQTETTFQGALKAIEDYCFDVVIADICLTGVRSSEGLDLVRFIRERRPKTHVVSMTGYGTAEVEERCYRNGANFYFNKPVDLRVLIDHLNKQGLNLRL